MARSPRCAVTPNHPMSRGALCVKCSAGYNNEWLDPTVRLTRPLRRTGPKGSGQFTPISWDEAIGTVADRLKRIDARSGPHTIINAHYSGTLSLLAFYFPMRFFHRLGATEVFPDSICNLAGHVALGYVFGTSSDGFDPRTVGDAACIVVWGANPAASAPHAFEHWFRPAAGTKIVVDPLRTETAKAADLHLQPFPGSDAALAFALLHVLRRDGLIDREFIARHTVGWDEVEPLLGRLHPGVGRDDDRRARRPDRAGRPALWCRTITAVARSGSAASADRRQRHARLLPPAGRDR